MQSSGQPATGAIQAKERLYTQLAGSFGRMNRALVQTSNLCELLQMDLHAMRTFVGLDAAMWVKTANCSSFEVVPVDTQGSFDVFTG
ncbi:hypothetical protein F5878DRAFT_182431 [Lentinula raphanica]|uniref:Uncharacterized protein n=1 Tax=Lentinula raphanica TaxID=153919 RepID=A0AA38UH87_9AGAR|nr:hypothetical protein F5878DRAFT_182431 [Lentinula raphanica]